MDLHTTKSELVKFEFYFRSSIINVNIINKHAEETKRLKDIVQEILKINLLIQEQDFVIHKNLTDNSVFTFYMLPKIERFL